MRFFLAHVFLLLVYWGVVGGVLIQVGWANFYTGVLAGIFSTLMAPLAQDLIARGSK